MAAERNLSRRIPDLRVGNDIDEIDKKLIPASIHPCFQSVGRWQAFLKAYTCSIKANPIILTDLINFLGCKIIDTFYIICLNIRASGRENLSSGVCEQTRSRPACASGQSDQCHCYSLIGKNNI